ncbi:hypothetical protein MMC29_006066 [Sticta canariensis]|nr:hypothetical protein [Sticta canariensis]
MSGVEVAGVVLGAFPILVNCLQYYRKGFEPLEEWWKFRTSFIRFIDDISHEMMKYTTNMERLLHPIIVDNNSFRALMADAKEPRWTDGSLEILLENRLASQYGRFLRIVDEMEEIVESLKKFLQINKDGDVDWIGSGKKRTWEWHLMRVKISFSKGKDKKVRKLTDHNQKLEEILKCSERMIPIIDARKLSESVALLEKIHQHACGVHSALKLYWNCPGGCCRSHRAHLRLRAETKSMNLNVLFVLESKQESCSKLLKKEVRIQPAEHDVAAPLPSATQIGDVQKGASFGRIQELFEKFTGKEKTHNSSGPFPELPKPPRSNHGEQAHSATPPPKTINPPVTIIGSGKSSSQLIKDLCWSLRNCQEPSFGVIADDHDHQFQLCRLPEPGTEITAPDMAGLVTLPDILEANHQASIDSLVSTTNRPVCEEDTRTALSTVGMIILELIFGRNIESCKFRRLYYGANDQANDLTNICTARKWAENVLEDSGPEIADVVWRCLNCSFGPRPNFQDKRFREAVYEGVIQPLADHLKIWQPVTPQFTLAG